MKPNPKLDTVHGQSIGRSVRVRATVTGIRNRLSGGYRGWSTWQVTNSITITVKDVWHSELSCIIGVGTGEGGRGGGAYLQIGRAHV